MLPVPLSEESILKAILTITMDGSIISSLGEERNEVVEIANERILSVVIDLQASLEAPTIGIQDDEAVTQLVAGVLEQGHQ